MVCVPVRLFAATRPFLTSVAVPAPPGTDCVTSNKGGVSRQAERYGSGPSLYTIQTVSDKSGLWSSESRHVRTIRSVDWERPAMPCVLHVMLILFAALFDVQSHTRCSTSAYHYVNS